MRTLSVALPKTFTISVRKITMIVLYGYMGLSIFEGYISAALGPVSRYYIFALIILLLFSGKKLTVQWPQVFLILWYLLYLCSALWAPPEAAGQMTLYFMSVTSMVILYVVFVGQEFTLKEMNNILLFYQICSVALGVLGIFFSVESGAGTRKTLVLFGNTIDPNNLVALYGIGSGLALYSLMFRKEYKLFNLLCVAVNAYCILLSGSRSGIILLAAQLTIVCLLGERTESKSDKAKRVMGVICLLLVVVGLGVQFVPEDILNRAFGLGNLSFFDGTGREDRWQHAIDLWLENGFLFGCGWGAYEAHGTFFTMLVDVGLVGVALFGTLLCGIVIISCRKSMMLPIMILITGMLPSFFIGAQNRRFFWNALILSTVLAIQKAKIKTLNDMR